MRMVHYFTAALILALPALLATALTGIFGRLDRHLELGLVTAILLVGLHTLVILFMIVTGRVLREAVRARELSEEFLAELNEFFARRAAYPAAVLGAVTIVGAGVLGYGAPAMGLPAALHMLAGLGALVVNLWAMPHEYAALRDNRLLVDRAAAELDSIDLALEARGELPVEEPLDPASIKTGAWIVAISAWMPYLYWGVIEHRGDFSSTSLHPWLEISVASLFVAWLARGSSTPRTTEE